MAILEVLNTTFKRTRILLASTLLLAAASTATDEVRAEDGERLFMKFHVIALGMRVANFKVGIHLTSTSYRIGGEMKTRGLADLFLSSSFDARSEGRHSNGVITPTTFHLETDSNKGERNTQINWDNQRMASASHDYSLAEYRVNDVTTNMRPDVLDPLATIVTASLQTQDRLCTGQYEVFDGKILYTLNYRLVKRDDFDSNDAGIYRGEAYQCEIVYRPVAGMSNSDRAEIAESGDGGEEIFRIWMAPVHSAVLDRTVFVTVGMTGTKDGHQFVLYLDHAEANGEKFDGG